MGSRCLEFKKMGVNMLRIIVATTIVLFPCFTMSESLDIPYTFNAGDPTSATQMNENFNAIKTTVNENSRKIDELSSNQSTISFVGFSRDEVVGNAGIGAMILNCNATFPESKVCTSGEIVNGTGYPESFDSTDQEGWVLPEFTPYGDNNKKYTDKWTGLDSINNGFLCHTESGSTYGIVLTWNGSFFNRQCEISRRVACCK